MNEFRRFYIFTGKGGVGKTTAALAFTKYLQSQDKKCLYLYFQNNKIYSTGKSDLEKTGMAYQSNVPIKGLDLLECSRGYIAKKLKSDTVASWIVKTPFFRSLINMIPGFSYVVYLGQIIELLLADPELIIVLDSPSSGHALTMLESTKNFNEIFKGGIVYEDTKLMLETMLNKGFMKINILALPTQLAVQEGGELLTTIKSDHKLDCSLYCNNSFSEFNDEELPNFLKIKLSNEEQARANSKHQVSSNLPYVLANEPLLVIDRLIPLMQSFT